MKSQKSSTIARCSSSVTRPTQGAAALADVAEQARPAGLLGAPIHAGRAGAHREDAQQQVERSRGSPRPARTARSTGRPCAWRRAYTMRPRDLVAEGDREVRVALVVAVLDVEPRVELLDPGVLELQRLDLGGDDGPLDAARRCVTIVWVRGCRSASRRSRIAAATAGSSPCRRRRPGLGVAEPVDARRLGNRARRGPVSRRICHGVQPTDGDAGTAACCDVRDGYDRAAASLVHVERPAARSRLGGEHLAEEHAGVAGRRRRRRAPACPRRRPGRRPTRPRDPGR